MRKYKYARLEVIVFVLVVLAALLVGVADKVEGVSPKRVRKTNVQLVTDWSHLPDDRTEWREVLVNGERCIQMKYGQAYGSAQSIDCAE